MLGTIVSFGYLDKDATLSQLERVIKKGALLIDCRIKPFSRHPKWNGRALERRFGTQYIWARGLGNIHYKTPGRIKLADPKPDLEALTCRIENGEDLVIMCCCADYNTCHRRVIIEELLARTNTKLVHV